MCHSGLGLLYKIVDVAITRKRAKTKARWAALSSVETRSRDIELQPDGCSVIFDLQLHFIVSADMICS